MNQLTHFRFELEDGIAVVTMDRAGESVNTLGPAVFDEILSIIERLEQDDVEGAVFTSAKRDFLVGADIRWFAQLDDIEFATAAIAEGQSMMARIEALHAKHGKPVVMAIHGAALGGGCELALCGSVRIATDQPKTQLGQPEVQLGILPAGGGTQRLPRLIGIAAALDLVLTGRPVAARKARKLGLVDEVVPVELLRAVAVERARNPEQNTKPRLPTVQRLALESNPAGRSLLFKQAGRKVLSETKGNYPAPLKALQAVRIGVEEGFEAGIAAEARFFGELVLTPQSRALRSIFFARRALEKETRVAEGVSPRQVDKVAILGGGLMGGGIAAVSAVNAGASVRIKEVDDAGVGRGLAHVRTYVDIRRARHRLTPFEAERATLRVTGSSTWRGFAGTDLVIEAVFEDLDLKQEMLRQVEASLGPDTVFASNTSSIPIADIASASLRPETVLGMHYFSPVEKMPLLEIIVTDQTADWAIATAVAFGKRQGKMVIVVNDGTGFFTSRVLGPYSNEAMFLLSEGASVGDIDEAMEAWGFPVGPFLLADEVGIDVGAKISKIMIEAFGDRMRGPEVMNRLVIDDRKGRKNRRGFYEYDSKGKRGGVDASVYEVLGLGPRKTIGRAEIQERISLQFINETVRCLEGGTLTSALDGDIGAVFGLGFPPFRGGPFHHVDAIGAETVVTRLRHYETIHGERFTPSELLIEVARAGTKFCRGLGEPSPSS